MTREKSRKAIKEIMEHFDWKKVHTAMTALDWTWNDLQNPPSIPKMKKMVETLFEDTLKHLDDKTEKDKNGCMKYESWYVESGGFRVTLWDRERLELAFNVWSWESDGTRDGMHI